MRSFITTLILGAMLISPAAFAAGHRLDPIFQVTPVDGRPDPGCFQHATDNRNPVVRALTSLTGQVIIGGLLGAALGNQIGDGNGQEIATGIGAAIGASLGARHARSQQRSRTRACQRYRGYANNYRSAAYRNW